MEGRGTSIVSGRCIAICKHNNNNRRCSLQWMRENEAEREVERRVMKKKEERRRKGRKKEEREWTRIVRVS